MHLIKISSNPCSDYNRAFQSNEIYLSAWAINNNLLFCYFSLSFICGTFFKCKLISKASTISWRPSDRHVSSTRWIISLRYHNNPLSQNKILISFFNVRESQLYSFKLKLYWSHHLSITSEKGLRKVLHITHLYDEYEIETRISRLWIDQFSRAPKHKYHKQGTAFWLFSP